MTEKTSFKDLVLRAVAVVGLVAVLLVGAWGIIQIAFYIPTLFDTNGGSQVAETNTLTTSSASPQTTVAPESLSLIAPNSIASKQAFLLSWNHQNETGAYAYKVSYSCASGVSLQAPVPTGTYKEVACNTPFNFVGATSSMPIVFAVSGKSQANTTITVAAQRLSDGAITSSASSTTVVLPAINTPTASNSTNTYTTTTKPTATVTAKPTITTVRASLYGLPDFSVQILSVTPSNMVAGQTHYTAQFVVKNVGTNVTPANWAFQALIPINGGYTYNSPVQKKLYPGDKIVYTLGFDVPNTNYNNQYTGCTNYNNTYPYNSYSYNTNTNCPANYPNYNYSNYSGTFTVTVDPQNIAQEINKSNNTASVSVSI